MNGILLMDKPPEWTSHDVIGKLRGLLRLRRIGHAGTLDPMATGLLTIFVGRATRAVEFAEAEKKTYIARLRFGLTTDTQDTTGRVLETSSKCVSREDLEAILPQFCGEISQIPPMYSAIKIDGQRLYKLARQGIEVARKARPVTVHKLVLLGQTEGEFELEITCSKGTYIRTLCHDIGGVLGCGGAMSALRRTQVGAFSVDESFTIEALQAAEDRTQFIKPLDTLFSAYPALTVDRQQEQGIRNGQTVQIAKRPPGRVRVYGSSGVFLAFGEIVPGPKLIIIKSFFEPNLH